MKASTDTPRRRPWWRPAALGWLALLTAGLAAGLWPDAIYPPRADLRPAPLPVLPAVAAAQAVFIFLVYPLVLMHRSRRGGRPMRPGGVVGESVLLMLAAAPFHAAGAWLGDASAADVARGVLAVAATWPVAWAAGALLPARRKAGSAVVLFLAAAALGLPAMYYIALEFFAAGPRAAWLWHLGPVTFAWENAAARATEFLPRPLWAWLTWPAAALAGLLLHYVLPGRRAEGDDSRK